MKQTSRAVALMKLQTVITQKILVAAQFRKYHWYPEEIYFKMRPISVP